MPNDKELLQQVFNFFSQYIIINEIGQDELQAEAEIILNVIQVRLKNLEPEFVYIALPKKEWVGLTGEEITRLRHLYDPTAHWSLDMFARAIEAKLKEKNGMD